MDFQRQVHCVGTFPFRYWLSTNKRLFAENIFCTKAQEARSMRRVDKLWVWATSTPPPASYVIESSPLGIALVCVRLYVSSYPEACLLCFEKGKRYEDWSSALRCGAAPLYCRGGGKGCVILMACLFLSRLSLTALFDEAKCLESWTSEDLPQISDNFCALFAVVGTLLLVR